ncbi:MAG: hypothetical protein IJQ88_10025 [Clostridia bacterium]|nr:hypothetical protein [Clostridia bacterium]
MQYRHKVTGVVIDAKSAMGGDWQAVKPAGPRGAGARSAKKNSEKKPDAKTADKKTEKG